MLEKEPIHISLETENQLKKLTLSKEDHFIIVDGLGREPNELELGIFGTCWCEHSGYRYSKPLLTYFDKVDPQ